MSENALTQFDVLAVRITVERRGDLTCTRWAMVSTTAGSGAYGFSLTLRHTGTSSCGAPYGSSPIRSLRSGRYAGIALLEVSLIGGRPALPVRLHGRLVVRVVDEAAQHAFAVCRQIFGDGEGVHAGGEGLQALLVVFDDFDRLHEGVHAEAGGEARGAAGRQHVVGAGHVVAQRHRGVRAAEDGAGVAGCAWRSRHPASAVCIFKVFGRVRVGRVDGLVDDRRSARWQTGVPRQRRVDALGVLGTRHAVLEALLHLVGNLGGVGDTARNRRAHRARPGR